MIFLYGDSHTEAGFRNLAADHRNLYMPSVTMHRCGRDNEIPNFNCSDHDDDSILCFGFGEVDCRCHIQKQINLGREEDEIIDALVKEYFNVISDSCKKFAEIYVLAIIFTSDQTSYEERNGPITHEFPFVGTNADRVRFTAKVNAGLEIYCQERGFKFFNPYDRDRYADENGCLRIEVSDGGSHLGDNTRFLEMFHNRGKNARQ